MGVYIQCATEIWLRCNIFTIHHTTVENSPENKNSTQIRNRNYPSTFLHQVHAQPRMSGTRTDNRSMPIVGSWADLEPQSRSEAQMPYVLSFSDGADPDIAAAALAQASTSAQAVKDALALERKKNQMHASGKCNCFNAISCPTS